MPVPGKENTLKLRENSEKEKPEQALRRIPFPAKEGPTMKKTIRKYLWLILCGVLLAVCIGVLAAKGGDPNAGMLPRDLDREFEHGSGFVLDLSLIHI